MGPVIEPGAETGVQPLGPPVGRNEAASSGCRPSRAAGRPGRTGRTGRAGCRAGWVFAAGDPFWEVEDTSQAGPAEDSLDSHTSWESDSGGSPDVWRDMDGSFCATGWIRNQGLRTTRLARITRQCPGKVHRRG